MSEPIKPNATAKFFNTTIPSLTDDANIQEALRMYHFGTPDGTIADDSGNPIRAESIAGYLGTIQDQLDEFTIGSEYAITEPAGIDNGYIWVDADSAAPIFGTPPASVPSVAKYQNAEPTENLQDGMLWVDKDSSPLKMYVYDAGTTSWKEIGA